MTTVLHIIDSLPREGAEMVVYDLVQQGDRGEFDFLVCALTRGGGVAEMLETIGVPVFILGRKSFLDLSGFRRLLGLIRERRVDVIQTHLFSSHLWGWAAALFFPRVRLLRTEHNMSEWKNPLRRALDFLLSFRTDRFIAVSAPVRQSLISRCRIDPGKVEVIVNGLNTDRLRPGSDPESFWRELKLPAAAKIVVTAAALTPKKGHRYLLAAAELVVSRRADAYFLLLGEGELRGELEKEIRERGLAGRVLLLGSRPDAVEIIGRGDLFLLSSIREGLPISLLEAMALKRPVVATSVGGCPDLINDGENGLLVPPRDGNELAGAIEKVLNHPELGERLGKAAGKTVAAGYGMRGMIDAYENLYRRRRQQSKETDERIATS
ncbi:MAG: glycosyltransferase [Candidatus Erginobacter occultus]|nr:glycosyltransferase [Candidatus Erginobacter occultus]